MHKVQSITVCTYNLKVTYLPIGTIQTFGWMCGLAGSEDSASPMLSSTREDGTNSALLDLSRLEVGQTWEAPFWKPDMGDRIQGKMPPLVPPSLLGLSLPLICPLPPRNASKFGAIFSACLWSGVLRPFQTLPECHSWVIQHTQSVYRDSFVLPVYRDSFEIHLFCSICIQ